MRTIAAATGVILLGIAPGAALAAVETACDVIKVFERISQWFGITVFILAVIAMFYAAFLFLFAGGSEEAVKKAKLVLLYAIIGIAVALFATQAVGFVNATIGAVLPAECLG